MVELEKFLRTLGIVPMSVFKGDDSPPDVVFVRNCQIFGLDEVKTILAQVENHELAAV